jgi:hypothetical protein
MAFCAFGQNSGEIRNLTVSLCLDQVMENVNPTSP